MKSPDPRKVCHLRATNFFGGPEKQILEHCRCLDPGRWSGVIATFREGRSEVELDTRAREAGLETFQIETRSSFSPRAIRLLRSELEARAIDVLVTHGYKSDLVGLLAGRGRSIPHFVHMRGFTGEDWKVKLYERLDLAVLRRVPGVICVSEGTRQLLIDRGVEASRASTVHNAVHVAKEIPGVDLHEEFGIPAGARVLVAAGRLSPEKGHAVLVDAFATIAAQHADLHLLILGEGPLGATLASQAAQLPGAERVHLAGFRQDVLGCLAASTLVVNPSYTEGLPNVVLEAFVAETPVVATSVGGVPELIEDSHTGYLVPSGDAEALAETIEQGLGDPHRARAMAAAARQLVEREFTFEAQADKLMALYDGARPQNRWPRLGAQPFITVVMPVRNEERFLEGTIRQLLDQDYPADRLEILVCDGMSDDSTREIVQRLSDADPRVRLIDNPGRRSSVGRNVGFKHARGEVSVVIDGHVHLPGDQLLASIARCFFESKAACLGRPQPLLATRPGSMSEAISNARGSRLGHSPSSFIHSDFEGFAPAASMGAAYRREVFEEIGYVNEDFDAGEDLEFNTRVDEAGMTCFTSPSLTVLYYARDDLRGLFKQMHRYGYGRYKYLRQHPSAISAGQMVPPLFVLGLGAMPFLPLVSWLLFFFGAACICFYALLVILASLALARRSSFGHFLRYLAIFPTIHAGLGAGFLSSILRGGKVRKYGPDTNSAN